MTDIDEITIFDEVVNCGILEEDSILNFGAGHSNGKFLETLLDYNGTLGEGLIVAVEPDSKRLKLLSKRMKGEKVTYIENSLQDYIDGEPETKDWTVITGVFDNNNYGTEQYNYITSVVQSSFDISNKGVIFTLKESPTDNFKYSMIYFFTDFANTYQRFTVKKFNDDNYIFCIYKQ